MMKITVLFIALAVGLVCFSGCRTTSEGETASPMTDINSQNMNLVTGTEWRLESMTIAGENFELVPDSAITMTLTADGRASGSGSINRYNGGFLIPDQGEIQWGGGFMTTRMAGPPALMEQEQKFFDTLTKTTRMSLQAPQLVLTGPESASELRFAHP